LPLEVQSKNWLKLFNNILYKCFCKVRVVNNSKKNAGNERLLHKRIALKKEAKLSTGSEEMKLKIEDRIFEIENEIGTDVSNRYHEDIVDTLKKLGGDDQNLNGSGRKQLWKFLKKKYPKSSFLSSG
jgi:hypothetical protein